MTDAYDNLNGSVQLAWAPKFGPFVPDSWNVYVNGVFNQNVVTPRVTVSGLVHASYNGATVTPSQKYDFRIVAVKAGVEIAPATDVVVTAGPTSVMLTTPMKRPFPFPNTAPGG